MADAAITVGYAPQGTVLGAVGRAVARGTGRAVGWTATRIADSGATRVVDGGAPPGQQPIAGRTTTSEKLAAKLRQKLDDQGATGPVRISDLDLSKRQQAQLVRELEQGNIEGVRYGTDEHGQPVVSRNTRQETAESARLRVAMKQQPTREAGTVARDMNNMTVAELRTFIQKNWQNLRDFEIVEETASNGATTIRVVDKNPHELNITNNSAGQRPRSQSANEAEDLAFAQSLADMHGIGEPNAAPGPRPGGSTTGHGHVQPGAAEPGVPGAPVVGDGMAQPGQPGVPVGADVPTTGPAGQPLPARANGNGRVQPGPAGDVPAASRRSSAAVARRRRRTRASSRASRVRLRSRSRSVTRRRRARSVTQRVTSGRPALGSRNPRPGTARAPPAAAPNGPTAPATECPR